MTREAIGNYEYYHVYNRGVDGRDITLDQEDSDRFVTVMQEFNSVTPVGTLSTALSNRRTTVPRKDEALVDIVAFCLNPNHYHLLLRQCVDNGISEYMKRFIGGYVRYFNERSHRVGPLFQGRFKVRHIDTDNYLLHVASYINLNDRVHKIGVKKNKLVRSSWSEYISHGKNGLCKKDIVIGQFSSVTEYVKFAHISLRESIIRKNDNALGSLLMEKM